MTQDIQKSSKNKAESFSGISFLQDILKEIAEFKGWEIIFQALVSGFIFWACYNLKIIYDFHTSPEFAHIPKYPFSDFYLAIIMIGVFMGYKRACQFVFFNFIKNRIDPTKFKTDEERSVRAKSVCQWIGNIIYYTFSTTTAFLLFRDQDFFPKILGGNGESVNMFVGLPYRREIPYAITFYMVQFGSHLQTLIEYCVHKWKDPKFWEMFLHHCMAVFLIFFSYMTCNVRTGILVLFVHDPCDIFLCTSRLIENFKNAPKFLKYGNYVIFIISWLFFRLYAFPKHIVGAGIAYYMYNDYGVLNSAMVFLIFMMAALVILHAYWFLLIFRILVAMLSGKKNYNLYDTSKQKQKKSN